jgi:citrate lyase beta subunit
MRSLLFVPGNSAKMMAKAAASGADVLIFDLEDAVHPDSKPVARQLVTAALASTRVALPATSGSMRSTAHGVQRISKPCCRHAPTASCCRNWRDRKICNRSLI